MKEKNKGITLIALIITIVIMLILLGITVTGVINGELFNKAGKAVSKTNDKVGEQQNRVDELMGTLTTIEGKQNIQAEVKRIKEILNNNPSSGTGSLQEVLRIQSEYDRILRIDDGELTYKISTDISEQEKTWLEELGIKVSQIDSQNVECNKNPNIYYIADEKNISKYSAANIGTLINFRTLVNGNNFNYDEARLIEDIYLNCNEQNQWVPIGTETNSFSKIFDGQMHTISGIYINDTTADCLGLFGYSKGSIKNVGVKNGSITGNNYIGGIVARCSGDEGTEIYRCFNEMNITANDGTVAGICGFQGRNKNISECYNTGTITASGGSLAGICGSTGWANWSLVNCYNRGEIVGGRQSGGIYGFSGPATLCNCYNTGKITSTYCGGSVFGMNYFTDLRDSFGLTGTFSSVSSYNNAEDGAKVTNCSMKSEAEMKSAEFVTILNTLTETVTDETTGEETIISTSQDVWVQDKTGINDGYPILKWQLEKNK